MDMSTHGVGQTRGFSTILGWVQVGHGSTRATRQELPWGGLLIHNESTCSYSKFFVPNDKFITL